MAEQISAIPSYERLGDHELFNDPSLVSISLRRHGQTENDPESNLAGQLHGEALQDTKEVANAWLDELPEDANISITNSPSFLPHFDDEGNPTIKPARARMTGAMYGAALRERTGDKAIGLSRSTVDKLGREGVTVVREQDQRLGDILEFHNPQVHAPVPEFVKAMDKTYPNGIDFFRDYLAGTVEPEVQEKYAAAGGIDSVDRAAMMADWLVDSVDKGRSQEGKNIELGISHEESIGSLIYQIGDYTNAVNGDANMADAIKASALVGYNEGFDIHVDPKGTAILSLPDNQRAVFDLEAFKGFIDNKVDLEKVEARLKYGQSV
jgi:hypothetical protein